MRVLLVSFIVLNIDLFYGPFFFCSPPSHAPEEIWLRPESIATHGSSCTGPPSIATHGSSGTGPPSTATHGSSCTGTPSTATHGSSCTGTPSTATHGSSCTGTLAPPHMARPRRYPRFCLLLFMST